MNCPSCKADLTGDPIPDKYLQHNPDCPGGSCYCLLYGSATHYQRVIGVYDINKDRTVELLCPDCGHRWDA